jgi:hypothetical protein
MSPAECCRSALRSHLRPRRIGPQRDNHAGGSGSTKGCIAGYTGVTEDQELWAAAAHIVRVHGDGAMWHCAKRMGELAGQGDQAGVATWKIIANRVEQLQAGREGEARH